MSSFAHSPEYNKLYILYYYLLSIVTRRSLDKSQDTQVRKLQINTHKTPREKLRGELFLQAKADQTNCMFHNENSRNSTANEKLRDSLIQNISKLS